MPKRKSPSSTKRTSSRAGKSKANEVEKSSFLPEKRAPFRNRSTNIPSHTTRHSDCDGSPAKRKRIETTAKTVKDIETNKRNEQPTPGRETSDVVSSASKTSREKRGGKDARGRQGQSKGSHSRGVEAAERSMVYVQMKKGRDTQTLFPAIVDSSTGDVTFIPKGRKTYVPFDPTKHRIVKKTSEAKAEGHDSKETTDEINEERQEVNESSSEDDNSASEEEDYEEKTILKGGRGRSKATEKSQAKTRKRKSPTKKSKTQQDANAVRTGQGQRATSRPQSYKEDDNSACSKTEDESESEDVSEEQLDDPAEEIGQPTAYASSRSGRFELGFETDGEDWRVASAIDY